VWESQSTNPRQPASLPFENVRFVGQLDTNSPYDLASLSAKIWEFEQSMRSEVDKVASKSIDSKTVAGPSLFREAAASRDASETDTVATRVKEGAANEASAMTTCLKKMISTPSLSLSNMNVDQYCLAAHLLSPGNSGLYDEFRAFMKMGVLEIHPSGIPVFSSDWFSKVDVILLDDMDAAWGTDADPDERYCVNWELRDTLEEQWVKSDYGWAMAEDPRDVVFDFGVLDEWRRTFEGRMEEKANISEGIGRFGL
jgi:hypothetical protein